MDKISQIRRELVTRFYFKMKTRAKGLGISDGELRDMVEEIVGEGIAVALNQIEKWDPNRGGFTKFCALKTAELFRDELRKHRLFLQALKQIEEDFKLDDGGKSEHSRYLIRREILNLFNDLTPEQRKALAMYHYLDIPVKEISQAMQRQPKAIYALLRRAREKLKKLMKSRER